MRTVALATSAWASPGRSSKAAGVVYSGGLFLVRLLA